jgi:hypothetical protein
LWNASLISTQLRFQTQLCSLVVFGSELVNGHTLNLQTDKSELRAVISTSMLAAVIQCLVIYLWMTHNVNECAVGSTPTIIKLYRLTEYNRVHRCYDEASIPATRNPHQRLFLTYTPLVQSSRLSLSHLWYEVCVR